MASGCTRCEILTAWSVAVDVTAAVFGVDAEAIRAESRGRGPRPPRSVWQAKKMAVHIAVIVSGCEYKELAGAIGFHKDTITTHCQAMREALADDDELEALSLAIDTAVRFRVWRARAQPQAVAA